jgi:hypothetical protein
MANLLQRASGVQPAPQAQPAEAQGNWIDDGDDVGSEAATPEEEAQMAALIEPAMGLIHGEATSPKVVEALKKGAQNLADTIGYLASQMLVVLQGEIEKQGKAVDDAVMMQAGELVVMELIEVAQAIGLAPDDEESVGKLFEDSILAGLQEHGRVTGAKQGTTPEQARQQLDGLLNSADQEGGPEANKLTSAIRNVINGGGQ